MIKNRMLDWVRLPSEWINNEGLKQLRWDRGLGADNIAALMLLIAIAHRAEQETGGSHATYDDLAQATHLSRAKISAGLDVLEAIGVLSRQPEGRSSYQLVDFNLSGGWAKLPARKLYGLAKTSGIDAFREFTLRRPAELNALKLYLLFAARRGTDTNLANISFDKITAYSGVDRPRIKQALSVLAVAGLVHVERIPSELSEYGVSNAYRLTHLDPHAHMGTRGRDLSQVIAARF